MTIATKRRLELAAAGLAATWLALAPHAIAQPPAKSSVTVTVKNVTSDSGAILGQLCPDADAFGTPNCVGVNTLAPARKGEVVLTFVNVPQGTYALALFHDENADGQLSVMTEPMAFGNGVMDLPPAFDSASLKVSGDLKTETTLFRIGS